MSHKPSGASAPSRTRREFLNLAAYAGVLPLLGVAGAARGGNEPDGNDLDRFVGWHMCGIIDTSKEMPGKEQHQHQGLMTTHGEFYPEMEWALQQISSRLYSIASGT